MVNEKIFITGIGTGVGKTIVSAILVEKFKADYWKPIQSGDLDTSDTINVKSLVSNNFSVFHPEAIKLSQPYSPHKSAALDGIVIDEYQIVCPATKNNLFIEGAGGLMVPINNQFLMIDLIKKLNMAVVLVSSNYLGSINHTILSIKMLIQYQIPIKGIIFNGVEDSYTTDFILAYTGIKLLGHLPVFNNIDKKTISQSTSHIINEIF